MSYKPKSAGRDIKQAEEQWQQSHEESYELLSLDKTGLKHAYVNIYTLKSVMQGQCIDRPTVTFPAVGNLPLDRYKIILLGDTETCIWTTCPRLLLKNGTATNWTDHSLSDKSNALTITPPGHIRRDMQ